VLNSDEKWTVITGDCLDVMAQMGAGSVAAVITDPPYGIGEARGKNRSRSKLTVAKDYGCSDWDDKRPPREVFDAMRSVGVEQIIFGGNYFADMLPPSSSWIVWDKDNTGDFADCELAWTSHKRAVRLIRWRWNGMLQQPGLPKDRREHPTQKPVGVMRWIVENYTSPGDFILDPFCGSGTTGVACIELGRRFVGIEINPEYAEIARTRIDRASRQERLDLTPKPKAEQEKLF
jgi:DNA modification methylase